MGENPLNTLINGRDTDCIDIRDRGFGYGDGLFETIAVIHGVPVLWDKHMARLSDGCLKLFLSVPDFEQLVAEVKRLACGQSGIAKLIWTRGIGRRGYAPNNSAVPTRIVQFQDSAHIPPVFDPSGVSAKICSIPLSSNPVLAGLKHLNRLEQVLAAREIAKSGYTDGLMLDMDQSLIEGISSNIFLIEEGGLVTPRLDRCGVVGVMRSCVIEVAAKLGINVAEERISRQRLLDADGMFLTNVLTGIRPINKIENRTYNSAVINEQLIEAVWRTAYSLSGR